MNIISPELALNIKQALWEGQSQADVATTVGVTQPTISRIANGKAYHDIPWPDGSLGAMSREQRLALHRTRFSGVRAAAVASQLARLSPTVTPKAIAKVIHEAAMAAEDNDDTELLGAVAEVGPPAADPGDLPAIKGSPAEPPPMVSLTKAKKALGDTKFAKQCARDAKLMDCVRQVLATLPKAQATPEQVERLARNMRR